MTDRASSSAKIAVVLGTRPEVVKMAGIIRLLGDRAVIVHTGQHWDRAMFGQFLDDFAIPEPHVRLDVGGQRRGQQIASAIAALDELFSAHPPAAVAVQGDTNAVVAGALAANANGIPLVHVEAGLRSFDRQMPEEHNRVVADHLADLCLAPTETNRQNLLGENIPAERIVVTGNTVVEAVTTILSHSLDGPDPAAPYGLSDVPFVLATLHRPENTDDPAALRQALRSLHELAAPILVPLHPRTRARIEEYGLQSALDGLVVVDPIGYADFLRLASRAALLVSDSGGVQEEASVLKAPVLVVRRSTERPEVLGTFATLVSAGEDLVAEGNEILADPAAVRERLARLPTPYGDGTASRRSVDALDALLGT